MNEEINPDIQVTQRCAPILVNLVHSDDRSMVYGTITGEPGTVIQWSLQRMGSVQSAPTVIRRGSLKLDENGLVPSHNNTSLHFVLSTNGRYRLLAAATDGLARQDSHSELNASHDGVVSSIIEIALDKPRKKNFIDSHPVGFVVMAILVTPIAIIVALVALISYPEEFGIAGNTIEIDLDKPRKKNFIARHPVGFAIMAVLVPPITVIIGVLWALVSHAGGFSMSISHL